MADNNENFNHRQALITPKHKGFKLANLASINNTPAKMTLKASKYDGHCKNKMLKYFPSDFFEDSLEEPYLTDAHYTRSHKNSLSKVDYNSGSHSNYYKVNSIKSRDLFNLSSRNNAKGAISPSPQYKFSNFSKYGNIKPILPLITQPETHKYKSSERMQSSTSTRSNEADKFGLPLLKSPQIATNPLKFKGRPQSLLRNSTNHPITGMSPLKLHPKISKIAKFEHVPSDMLMTHGVKRRGYHIKSKYIPDENQENFNENIEEPTPKFNDGFYETFSKNGNVQPASMFNSHMLSRPEIEVSNLDEDSGEDYDFIRNGNASKMYTSPSVASTSDLAAHDVFDTNQHSDFEAYDKRGKKKVKILKKNIKNSSNENKKIIEANSALLRKGSQPLCILKFKEQDGHKFKNTLNSAVNLTSNSRNDRKFDGSKRVLILHDTASSSGVGIHGKISHVQTIPQYEN